MKVADSACGFAGLGLADSIGSTVPSQEIPQHVFITLKDDMIGCLCTHVLSL